MNPALEQSSSPAKQAVIYCRVSSVAQVEEGHGLESQETRCREYADRKGYNIIETFYEKAISGGIADRPSFNALLRYLRQHRQKGVAVIIDDISRFSRDIESHWALRRALQKTGGTLESPMLAFGEDSDSILIENLLASVSQHQRQKNGEQTKNRMRGRMMNGYWVFRAPIGFEYKKNGAHGKLLVRKEPLASIIQEALEGFASGRFETQGEVKHFLDHQPAFPKDRKTGEVRYEEIIRLLRRPHYAGYIEAPDWDISLRKGHHEGFISFEDYTRIQERIKTTAKAPARKDISEDFPLRGFVACGDCDKPLTANWSTSKTKKKHPYYMCFNKSCDSYRKSIRRDVLEEEFTNMVRTLQPKEELCVLAKAMFTDAWGQRLAQAKAQFDQWTKHLKQIDIQIKQLLDRILVSSNQTVMTTYENRITELEKEKALTEEKLLQKGQPSRTFDEMFELALRFLANPYKLWASGQIHLQRAVLRLAFAKRIRYHRKSGLRTPDLTLPFKMLDNLSQGKNIMAEREGFEPSIRY